MADPQSWERVEARLKSLMKNIEILMLHDEKSQQATMLAFSLGCTLIELRQLEKQIQALRGDGCD